MFNLKSVVILATFVLPFSSSANEVESQTFTIDTSEIHATISEQLDAQMDMLYQNIDEDLNAILIAQREAEADSQKPMADKP